MVVGCILMVVGVFIKICVKPEPSLTNSLKHLTKMEGSVMSCRTSYPSNLTNDDLENFVFAHDKTLNIYFNLIKLSYVNL